MTPRLACCVPFCQRTIANKEGWTEWLCPDHWRLVNRKIKALRARVRRKIRLNRYNHGRDLDAWLWREAKRQAIERAAGISA